MKSHKPEPAAYEEGRAAVAAAVAAVENLSVQEKIDLAELELRSEIARNIIRQFVRVNLCVLAIVALVFLFDEWYVYSKLISASDRIIDSKIIMTIIGATTVQFGAIAFAVSQWLFPRK
jgi:hypothetical protein